MADRVEENLSRAMRGVPMASSTKSLYYDVMMDFGIIGGFVVSALLAIISHGFSVQWILRGQHRYLLRQIPLAIMLMFWGYSHQYSIFKEDVLFWMSFTFLTWDFGVAYLSYQKRPWVMRE